MPTFFAASMTKVPGAACTSCQWFVSFTRSAILPLDRHQPPRLLVGTRLPVQVILEFVPELLDNRNGRHRRRVAPRTKYPPEHVLREIADQIDIAPHAAALVETRQNLLEPGRAF